MGGHGVEIPGPFRQCLANVPELDLANCGDGHDSTLAEVNIEVRHRSLPGLAERFRFGGWTRTKAFLFQTRTKNLRRVAASKRSGMGSIEAAPRESALPALSGEPGLFLWRERE
jgi:hypothetical protein